MSFDQTDRPAFRVVRRGYDRVQVNRYLDSLEDDMETLRSRVERLEPELESARQRANAASEDVSSQARYAAVSDHAAQVMQALDDEVERLRTQANEEVELKVSEARAYSDRIRQDAEIKANEVRSLADDALQEARKAADAIRIDARDRAEETLATAGGLVDEARQQAGRVLSDLEHRRRSLYGKLRRTRNAVDKALSGLDPEIGEGRPADDVVVLHGNDDPIESVDG